MIISILIFIIELCKYGLTLQIYFDTKIKRFWTILFGLVMYTFITASGKLDDSQIHIVMFAIVIIVLYVSIEEKNKKILPIMMLVLVITCIDELAEIPIDLIVKQYKGNIRLSDLKYLGSSLNSFIIIIILTFIIKRNKITNIDKIMKYITKRIYFVILIMSILLLLTIAGLNYARTYVFNDKFEIYTIIVGGMSYFFFGLIGVLMIYIKNSNDKMEQLMQTERKLKDMYIKYYEDLLEKEEDTRRYRHDINNHLVCLNELVKSEKVDLAKAYINKMQSQMNAIQKKCYCVGNQVLDAILNYYLTSIKKNVTINIKGKCISDIKVDNVDLCTIFSNLIQNAVEELSIESTEEKKLNIIIQEGKDYVKIEIINSISNIHANKKGDFFKTQKHDRRNHGIGLQNVKSVIQRNGGVFNISIENNLFKAIVILEKES